VALRLAGLGAVDAPVLDDYIPFVVDEDDRIQSEILRRVFPGDNSAGREPEALNLSSVVEKEHDTLFRSTEGRIKPGLELAVIDTEDGDIRVGREEGLEAGHGLVELVGAVVAGDDDGDTPVHTGLGELDTHVGLSGLSPSRDDTGSGLVAPDESVPIRCRGGHAHSLVCMNLETSIERKGWMDVSRRCT